MIARPEHELLSTPPRSARLTLLNDFFAQATQRFPENIAVDVPPSLGRSSRSCITYAQLNAWSNRIASQLDRFVSGEQVIGILLSRSSPHLYAAQLGVLKSGAAYTCIDPSFPDERVREILSDAKASVLLTDTLGLSRLEKQLPPSVTGMDVSTHCDPSEVGDLNDYPNQKPTWLTPESLAYIIYTSGTTGRPKGVMIEHRSISNLVASDLTAFQLQPTDRVAQSSSAAYDSSIEETWLALAAGATLVVLDESTSRSGPDLIPWLQQERINVFCPPPTLLRATGCEDPEAALPDLKLLYVGGEALPRDVADLWSRGRKLVNGYGPTECAVTCLRDQIFEHQPIAIGRPISGTRAWVLDESLQVAAEGAPGELCIGGVCVARGYWNDPELTAKKFVSHPQLGRLYRTGDLVTCDPQGQFYCRGRMDSQVKIRGYRVELEEIESRLAACEGVRSAACCVREDSGHAVLAAFIVPDDIHQPPSVSSIRTTLSSVLPGHMVPAHYAFLEELPTTTGGKLNRSALPPIHSHESLDQATQTSCSHPTHARIEAAFRQALRWSKNLAPDDDFFTTLGGDSLTAAIVITLLRQHRETASLAVRDLYEAPTISQLSQKIRTTEPDEEATSSSSKTHCKNPALATTVQTAWLFQHLVLTSALAYWVGFHLVPWLTKLTGFVPLILLGPPIILLALLLYTPLAVVAAAMVKRVLVGDYKPMRAEVWGDFYVRNWIVQRAVHLIPWWLIEGTEFQMMALRALGAKIGRRVHLHRGVQLLSGGWDLLEIGDDVTLGQDATLRLVELDGGYLLFDTIRIQNGCTLEIQTSVGGNSTLETNAYLSARSSLSRGTRIPEGQRWEGIPARPAGNSPLTPSLTTHGKLTSPALCGFWLIAAKLLLLAALAVPAELMAISLANAWGLNDDHILAWWTHPTFDLRLVWAFIAITVAPTPAVVLIEALACRLMGRIPEGVSSRWSLGYIRMWLKAGLVDSGSRWLYGTLFWPAWLRLAGMRVGSGCEISSLIDTIPESVEIGDMTFCADGIYIGSPQIHRGTVTIAQVRLGANSFVGNGAIISAGQRLPNDVLLGVCTISADAEVRAGTGWFGDPPFELPRREVIRVSENLTHHPGPSRYLSRLFWETLRFALPIVGALMVEFWFVLLSQARDHFSWVPFFLIAVPLITLGIILMPAMLTIAVKWLLLGRVQPGVHPLWSSWASRWDFVCLTWSLYTSDVVAALNGTLHLNSLIRLMGAKVGRGVVLGHGVMQDLPDPDMITLEDGASVDCLFQAHTFEDRVLKLDRITIRKGASVGRHALLLYGADVGEGARVSPNSVVMKHEHLSPNRNYAGFPIRQVDTDPW